MDYTKYMDFQEEYDQMRNGILGTMSFNEDLGFDNNPVFEDEVLSDLHLNVATHQYNRTAPTYDFDLSTSNSDLHAAPYNHFQLGSRPIEYRQTYRGAGGTAQVGGNINTRSRSEPGVPQHDRLQVPQNPAYVSTSHRPQSYIVSETGRTEETYNTREDDTNDSRGDGDLTHDTAATTASQYSCEHPGCDKSYTRPSDLTKHERSHTAYEDRPFMCNVCQTRWLFEKDLRRHQKVHAAAEVVCDICGRAFRRDDHLKRHKAQLHPPGPRPGRSRMSSSASSAPQALLPAQSQTVTQRRAPFAHGQMTPNAAATAPMPYIVNSLQPPQWQPRYGPVDPLVEQAHHSHFRNHVNTAPSVANSRQFAQHTYRSFGDAMQQSLMSHNGQISQPFAPYPNSRSFPSSVMPNNEPLTLGNNDSTAYGSRTNSSPTGDHPYSYWYPDQNHDIYRD